MTDMMINGARTKIGPEHTKLMEKIEAAEAANETPKKTGWRDILPIHPAAELTPLMTEDDLRGLADDIERNDLLVKVTVSEQDGVMQLIDGRNRLDALELLGREIFVSKYSQRTITTDPHQKRMTNKTRRALVDADTDRRSLSQDIFRRECIENPYAYVRSKNLERLHLTLEKKRETIAKFLTANPEKSNRQIAKEAKADDKTVAKVRSQLEATADIPQLNKTTGKDGKARPAKRSIPKPDAVPSNGQVLKLEVARKLVAKAIKELLADFHGDADQMWAAIDAYRKGR
jgi:ParB-like nuclease domain